MPTLYIIVSAVQAQKRFEGALLLASSDYYHIFISNFQYR